VADDLANAATAQTAPGTPATLLAGRYEVLGLLGSGGMGRVYRARDSKLDEVVALKILRKELAEVPGMLERFRQEVKLARRVTHANVVRTFDLGQHEDDHFLTMEYVDGRSLGQLLDDGPLATDEALRIARAVAAGLEAAHASAVTHRDLKPDNVLVGRDGRIAINDFGIARLAATPDATGDKFIGTPAYMAPEQVEGREVTAAADVYAFGAIVFELVTGKRAWVGDDPFAVALARLRQPPPDPRQLRAVPDALAALVMRCMAREPDQRWKDGGELVRALASIHDVDATAMRSFPRTTPAKQSRAVAILPLRASGDLAEIAEGLSEEIVDALTMTRALRVRPLASVRAATKADIDSRELGQQLGVDVVVDGSIRKRGTQVRISARAIGVDDGFQLWASHFDCGHDGLLAVGEEVVRAIARALVVDLEVPERGALDARIAERYLEGKARLRAGWVEGRVREVIESLDQVLPEAPTDPRVLATLAMALARSGFYGNAFDLIRARELAERALAVAPTFGEAQLARAFVHFYENETPAATRMLFKTVQAVPGFALAQGFLGSLLLEAGALPQALLHLEAARSIDPTAYASELARAYVYDNRFDDAVTLLTSAGGRALYVQSAIARYSMWRGEAYQITADIPDDLPAGMANYMRIAKQVHATRQITAEQREGATAGLDDSNPRLRATRSQFVCEYLMFCGEHDLALGILEGGVTAGLTDQLWMERCPLLAPLRGRPEFQALARTVEARAQAVLDAVFHAES
jgi:TolB-like protein/predicted Ser/Thr protein kinase